MCVRARARTFISSISRGEFFNDQNGGWHGNCGYSEQFTSKYWFEKRKKEKKNTRGKNELRVNQFQSMDWFFFFILLIMTYVFTYNNFQNISSSHQIHNEHFRCFYFCQFNVKQLPVGCIIWDGSSDIISIVTTFQLFSFVSPKKNHHINDIIASQTK